MESKAKALGHPIHPMLVVFPLGLLVSTVIFDWLARFLNDRTFALVGHWNLVAGLIGGAAAAPFGLRDYLAIPDGTRARSVGQRHGIINATMLLLFFVAWLMRRGEPDAPATWVVGLETVALALGTVGAWLGGELVDRLGVGVDPEANLNAPSSLSPDPASVRQVE
jgi:uncharacterized membrane protein